MLLYIQIMIYKYSLWHEFLIFLGGDSYAQVNCRENCVAEDLLGFKCIIYNAAKQGI